MSESDEYPSPTDRRRAAGAATREQTRRSLLDSADQLFRARGYAGTTVAEIAARAGYSLQSLYTAWGSKRELLRAAITEASVASQRPTDFQEWRSAVQESLSREVQDQPTAASYLTAASRMFVEVADRTADYWRIHRDAAASDPEIAADWQEILSDRRRTMIAVAQSIPSDGLRPELDRESVAETLWALASPELYDLFTTQGERDSSYYREWLAQTLQAALCAEPPEQAAAPSNA